MKTKKYLRLKEVYLLFVIMLGVSLSAQNKKVLIVPTENDSLVHCNIGLTAFSNFVETLDVHVSLSKVIEEKLIDYLGEGYDVTVANVPEKLKIQANGFWGQGKDYKNWLEEAGKGYDILIVISNIDISNEMQCSVPRCTNGFFSRGAAHGVYTTISLEAYLLPAKKNLEYYSFGSKVFVQLKDFKMPKDKKTFDADMLETIRTALISQADNRVKYFLAKTYILPNLK